MSVRVVPMSEEQHKSAKKRWGLVKAEVKVGMFGKAMQHKKKIAAAITVKIIIYRAHDRAPQDSFVKLKSKEKNHFEGHFLRSVGSAFLLLCLFLPFII